MCKEKMLSTFFEGREENCRINKAIRRGCTKREEEATICMEKKYWEGLGLAEH